MGLAVSTLVNRSVWRDLVAVRLAKVRASLVLLVARSSRPSLAQVARYSSPLVVRPVMAATARRWTLVRSLAWLEVRAPA